MRSRYWENPDFKRIQSTIQQTPHRMRRWKCEVFYSMPTGFWLVVAESIYRQLGNCPGNLCDYHIDHIVPLATFGYGWERRWMPDPFHRKSVKGYRGLTEAEVLTLLHPDNYRWILKSDNLSKSGRWDQTLLLNWLKAHPCLKSRRYHPDDNNQHGHKLLQVKFQVTGSWIDRK